MGRCIVSPFGTALLLRYDFKPMRLFVRYLLWILIVALPLQGGAAAFTSCGAERVHASAQAHQIESANAGADTSMAHEHCGNKSSKESGPSHGKCSSCASCCVGALAPPAVLTILPSSSFSTFASPEVELAMTTYFPATLKRPPRRHA